MKVEIENLKALVKGRDLTPFQKGGAFKELIELTEHLNKLEEYKKLNTPSNLEYQLNYFPEHLYLKKIKGTWKALIEKKTNNHDPEYDSPFKIKYKKKEDEDFIEFLERINKNEEKK